MENKQDSRTIKKTHNIQTQSDLYSRRKGYKNMYKGRRTEIYKNIPYIHYPSFIANAFQSLLPSHQKSNQLKFPLHTALKYYLQTPSFLHRPVTLDSGMLSCIKLENHVLARLISWEKKPLSWGGPMSMELWISS